MTISPEFELSAPEVSLTMLGDNDFFPIGSFPRTELCKEVGKSVLDPSRGVVALVSKKTSSSEDKFTPTVDLDFVTVCLMFLFEALALALAIRSEPNVIMLSKI